ncbi:MAG: nucleoside hydrolase [bacterium]
MTLKIHLDTDIGGDTDDLCALALLLASPEVELVGITTCADAEGRRKTFAEHALKLAGRTGIPVATGARGFLGGLEHFPGVQDVRYWPGAVQVEPGPAREGLDLLEASARSGATIVAVGPFTNLAMLESLRPGVFAHAPVVVMGGYLGLPPAGYPQWPSSYDYNVQADRVAARIVYEKLDPLIASLNVTLKSSLRRRDLAVLKAGGPLARLMALQAELHCENNRMEKLARDNLALPSDLLNFQYDSVACAAAIGLDSITTGVERRALDVDGEQLVLRERDDAPERRFVVDVDTDEFSRTWLERVSAL